MRDIQPGVGSVLTVLLDGTEFTATYDDSLPFDEAWKSIEYEGADSLPSLTKARNELKRQQKEWAATEYQRLRAPEYPPLSNLADAVYWQAQGDDKPMNAYIAACEAVKKKYPKPD